MRPAHMFLICLAALGLPANPPEWVGLRSSIYGCGREGFPTGEAWSASLQQMASRFPGSRPAAIWIVGALDGRGCRLEFPRPKGFRGRKHLTFLDRDRHEETLRRFDKQGVDVFLQVEPGFADVDTLMDLVLRQYRHHPCVKGFGIDVEWYRGAKEDSGIPVKDRLLRRWERRLLRHGRDQRLFVKHYDARWLGRTHRGRVIFVDDSQEFKNLDHFLKEMTTFAQTFAPNPVLFQIGYPKDRPWWKAFSDPVSELGNRLAAKVQQPWGLVWVDFTMREVLDFPKPLPSSPSRQP